MQCADTALPDLIGIDFGKPTKIHMNVIGIERAHTNFIPLGSGIAQAALHQANVDRGRVIPLVARTLNNKKGD